MATKGGSLLGKADSTLAAMSYKEAMADVTPDYGDVYEAQALNQMVFQKGVEDHFKNLHADYNALGDELKETTTAMMANLSAGTTPDEAGIEMFNSELNTLRQRLKAAPKGKKGDLERAKIRAELGRLKNSTEGMDQTLTTLGTMIENDQFDALATGQDLPLLLAISKGEATKKIENGNLVYSIKNPISGGKDITMTQQDLKDALVLKDPKFAGNFNKIHAGFNDVGKQKGTTWENKRQGAVNAYEDIFTTKHTFATTINNKQGNMEYSLVESLTGKDGNDEIYKILMGMSSKDTYFKIGKHEFDADKDGDVDADDFAHPVNGAKLINALTNIKDKENFDFQTAKKVAAEYYADGLAKSEFEDGEKMRGDGQPKWKAEGFSNYGAWTDYHSGVTKTKNKNIDFDFYSGAKDDNDDPIAIKRTTDVNTLIDQDNQLSGLMNQSSFDTESYVDLYGQRIGYFPGKGFTKVRLATRDDVSNEKFKNSLGRPIKVGEIIRINPGSDVAYWKSPKDVFRHFSIPTTYSEKQIVLTKEEKEDGVEVRNGKMYKPAVKDGKKGWILYTRQ